MLLDHARTIYGYRNLIRTLAWGEFKQRYKNSILGYFWSLLEPLLMLVVLYVVFSNLMRIQVEYYQLFLLLGIILWNFLARATSLGLSAIVGRPSLVQKIYFPRDILVISICITALLMSIFESVVFALFMVVFQVPPSPTLVYVPLILLILFVFALGISLAIAALNVYYRDVQFIWAVVLQAGFFATPILYPVTIFPEGLRELFLLNPMAHIVIEARNTIIYATAPSPGSLLYAGIASLAALAIGYLIFARYEPGFAEEM
ncbi:MAG: ABC transporter permease [Methanomicrobiales archaeon]|nr:ABC transporter permease [Methanomicrobiales archaeon]MDI6876920.1 ABC transporter permease [Methanomicrobiales archaeon]